MKIRSKSFLVLAILFVSLQVNAQNILLPISFQEDDTQHLRIGGSINSQAKFYISMGYLLSSIQVINLGYSRAQEYHSVEFSWNSFVVSLQDDIQIGIHVPLNYSRLLVEKESGNGWISLSPGVDVIWILKPTVQFYGNLSIKGSIWAGTYTVRREGIWDFMSGIFALPHEESHLLIDEQLSLCLRLGVQFQMSSLAMTYISLGTQGAKLLSGSGAISNDSRLEINLGLLLSI